MLRIIVRDAAGNDIETLFAHSGFDPVSFGIDRSEYPMLGHLDPHGDTILNGLQMRTLLQELARARAAGERGLGSSEFQSQLERLVGVARERVHRFLWFIGD